MAKRSKEKLHLTSFRPKGRKDAERAKNPNFVTNSFIIYFGGVEGWRDVEAVLIGNIRLLGFFALSFFRSERSWE